MKRWQLWLGIVISALLLFLALRGLDFKAIWETLQSAEYTWIIPGILIYMIGLWLRTLRWQMLLRPIKNIRAKELFKTVAIGYMGNNIYPARMGELVRAYILKREDDIVVSASLATIIVERIFDGVIMLGFILLNLSIIDRMSHGAEISATVNAVSLWGTVIFFTAFFIFILSAVFPEKISHGLKRIVTAIFPEKIQQNINSVIDKFFLGLQTLSSPLMVIIMLLLSIAIWVIEACFYWFVMRALPFRIEFSTLVFLVGFLNLFTIIPSSPGYVGTFDAPSIAILTALGIDPQYAAGYTLLLHAALWLPVTLIGVYFFARKGISWNDAIQKVQKEKE